MRLYGVGVGPGDPELITLKALKVIKDSDVVVVPYTSSMLTYNAIKDYLKDKEVIRFNLPIRRNREDYKKLSDQISSYDKVAYVTLGDPAFYSSFYRLAEFLEPYEVVPGVTSFSWCSAFHKILIVLGRENVLISTEYPPTRVDKVIVMKREEKMGTYCGNSYFTVSILKKQLRVLER
ncbi:MAG: precorrin-2 C(20)-methyltransferase [Candidatus Aramenus sulfurataquae]|jgi:precorrin-2/cobalt-factor-2 C20-methyltransferase|uniref:Precorrin-2 C(20)-methyltransferase n=2 Tax=Candidatus Aramenus sulfurataquae TaxID=1326980 RepID=A0A0F2LNP5_9CREN|nr:precorrin-2 C(20)-methyltransferase [Candidatus Aramenus sulfurataquae]